MILHWSQSISASTCCVLSGEAAITSFIVVGFTLPTTYWTGDEHANKY